MFTRPIPPSVVRFGVFEVNLTAQHLRKHGVQLKIRGQPFEILTLLLEKPGEVVTREQLRVRLWPADTFVDFEHGLNSAVKRLRKVLGDSPENSRYVETIPRVGYRFIAPVELTGNRARNGTDRRGDASSEQATPSTEVAGAQVGGMGTRLLPGGTTREVPESIAESKRFTASRALAGGMVVILVAAFALLYRKSVHRQSVADFGPAPDLAILPLISLPGEELMPAYSPDGSRVAFVWQALDQRNSGIYAAVVGSQSLMRLSHNASDYSPAWSPDGRDIAFLRDSSDKFFVELVPALGGSETRIYTGSLGQFRKLTRNTGLSFSPDGKLLVFTEWNEATQQDSIRVLSIQDASSRFLVATPASFQDRSPAFSPSGDKVAFVRSSGPIYVDELFVASLASGQTKQLTFDHKRILGPPGWTRGGEILFSSNRAGLTSIWRISLAGGSPQAVPRVGPVAQYPSVSPAGSELAYEHMAEEENLWRLELRDETHSRGTASILLTSAKTFNFVPHFSPDGRKIAFQSQRSGYPEIWICDADGSNPVQMTNLQAFAGSPSWSPDGRYLVFDYRPGEHSEIDVIEIGHKHPRSVAVFPDADNVLPSWSRDGLWLYFASNRRGQAFQLWKIAVKDGVSAQTPAVQVTKNGGFYAVESSDGRSLFYTKLSEPGIWRVPRDGGNESTVWHGPGPDYWSNWALAKDGIYFFLPRDASPAEIEFLNLRTRQLSRVAEIGKPSFFGLALSPDGKSLVYPQQDRNEHDVVIMTNFR